MIKVIFEEWAPTYRQILKDFNFSEKRDADSAAYLSQIYQKQVSQSERENTFENLKSQIFGKCVVICGNAPALEKDLAGYFNEEMGQWIQKTDASGCLNGGKIMSQTDQKKVWMASDGAAVVLLKQKILPDIIVTDLDGKNPDDAEIEIKAADDGALLVIHAHGDNQNKLEKYAPKLEKRLNRIIPTCQCLPPANIYNFGGFTDGDRGLFLAEELGAAHIVLLGFDFEDTHVTDLKKKKLAWAEKLIRQRMQKNPGKIEYFNDGR